jgi:hypothetical protein
MSDLTGFEKTYEDYLAQISTIDLRSRAKTLAARIVGKEMLIPFFGMEYKVSAQGILDSSGKQPTHSIVVILCKYVLLCPEVLPAGEAWVSYKDFKDAAPFVGGFVNHVEKAIAKSFAGRLEMLRSASERLGGRRPDEEYPYQVSMRFEALPRVPLLMLFNDEDDEFPARCLVLFERRAERYLDMECLAIAGWLLADYLNKELKTCMGS